MYSSGSASHGSIHPVPVDVATATTARSKAWVRFSSSSTSDASPESEDADARPAYTRIGVIAGRPVTDEISAEVGPPATNVRPSRPSDFQLTSDAGLPERSADVGCLVPGCVPWSA